MSKIWNKWYEMTLHCRHKSIYRSKGVAQVWCHNIRTKCVFQVISRFHTIIPSSKMTIASPCHCPEAVEPKLWNKWQVLWIQPSGWNPTCTISIGTIGVLFSLLPLLHLYTWTCVEPYGWMIDSGRRPLKCNITMFRGICDAYIDPQKDFTEWLFIRSHGWLYFIFLCKVPLCWKSYRSVSLDRVPFYGEICVHTDGWIYVYSITHSIIPFSPIS